MRGFVKKHPVMMGVVSGMLAVATFIVAESGLAGGLVYVILTAGILIAKRKD